MPVNHLAAALYQLLAPLCIVADALDESCQLLVIFGVIQHHDVPPILHVLRKTAPRRRAKNHWQSERHGFEGRHARSEEHTSELQSLMRISYAVFCLTKKN